MARSIYYFLMGLFLLALYSCEYQLDDIQVVTASPPDLEDFDVDLTIENSTELVIYKPTNFYYEIRNNTNYQLDLLEIIISFDGIQYKRIDNSIDFDESIRFLVLPDDFDEGVYTMRIEAISRFQGNNNIAGLTGAHSIILDEWEVIVDLTPDPISIEFVKIEGGKLVVYWDSTRVKDYDQLQIVGDAEEINGTYGVFVDKNQNKATYPYFLNGKIELKIRSFINESPEAEGPVYSYQLNENLVDIKLEDSIVVAHFNKPSLYGHVSHVYVDNTTEFTNYSQESFSIELDRNLLFGEIKDYFIGFTIANEEHFNVYYTIRAQLGIGKEIPEINNIIYSKENQYFYASYVENDFSSINKGTFIYKMDNNLNVLDTLVLDEDKSGYVHLAMTPGHEELAVLLADENDVYFIEPHEFEVLSTTNLLSTYNYEERGHLSRYGIKITDTNILYIRGNSQIAIDLNSSSEIFRGPGGIIGQNGDISDNGSYIFNDGKLYEWNGFSYFFKTEIDSEFKSGMFLSDNLILHFGQDDIKIINCQSLDVVNTFTYSSYSGNELGTGPVNQAWIRIDREKNRLITFESEVEVESFDFSGSLISREQAKLPGTFFYLNGFLISNNGRAIKLEL